MRYGDHVDALFLAPKLDNLAADGDDEHICKFRRIASDAELESLGDSRRASPCPGGDAITSR